MPKRTTRGTACHFLYTWTLPQTCTATRSQHQDLSSQAAPASIDSFNEELQPCKPKVVIFPCSHLWPVSQIFGTHLHVSLETATLTQIYCLHLSRHPVGLHFHANPVNNFLLVAPEPQKPSGPQFPGIVTSFHADPGNPPDTPPDQNILGLHCLSLTPKCHSHLPQPVLPRELPRPGWCKLVKVHSACRLNVVTHQPHTLSMCPGTLRRPHAICMYQGQSSPAHNQTRSNKQLSQSSLRRP